MPRRFQEGGAAGVRCYGCASVRPSSGWSHGDFRDRECFHFRRDFTTLKRLKTVPYRIEVGAQSVPLGFVRNRKARRYILRLMPGGTARVTIPRGGTVEYALEFARKNGAWLQRQLQQLQRGPAAWGHGTEILFRGAPEKIEIFGLEGEWLVRFAGLCFRLQDEGSLRTEVEARLRQMAIDELVPRTFEIAGQHALQVRSVQVRDQRSRWGSCSTRKTISLNWRLIQTPDFVRDYIIVHELMHLREMNHSPKFWAHVAAAFPAYLEAERWLRKNSRLLR
jgi:predicted metal-dependent hydrolase